MPHAHHASVESSWVSASLILVALIYLRGWLRLRRHNFDSVQAWRAGGFMLGLFLILLGAPVKTLLYRLPHRLVQVMGRAFQSTGMHQVWSALTHPVICWLGAASTLVAWHIPAVFVLGMRSQPWHGIEQASFLASGLLFWWPVVQPLPNR